MEALINWAVQTFMRPTISLGVLAVIVMMLCLQARLGLIGLVAAAGVAASYWRQIVGFIYGGA